MEISGSGGQVLIGCGILSKEIAFLVEKNQWPLRPRFLPSSLHTDFHKLGSALEKTLQRYGDSVGGVFYGACHPLIGRILGEAGTVRTPGQNCIEIYLGEELFSRELSRGAFFLFEEWAQKWDEVMELAFGGNPHVIREILASAHSYLLAIRTPCSGDFSKVALEVSQRTGLEVRWMDAGLERLEENLARTLKLDRRGMP